MCEPPLLAPWAQLSVWSDVATRITHDGGTIPSISLLWGSSHLRTVSISAKHTINKHDNTHASHTTVRSTHLLRHDEH